MDRAAAGKDRAAAGMDRGAAGKDRGVAGKDRAAAGKDCRRRRIEAAYHRIHRSSFHWENERGHVSPANGHK